MSIKRIGYTMTVAGLASAFLAASGCNDGSESQDTAAPAASAVRTYEATHPAEPAQLTAETIGEIRNVHRYGNVYTAGQPTEADFARLREAGVVRLINLRTDGEVELDEAVACEANGIEYHHLPFRSPETLTDELFASARGLLREADASPTIVHCGSANRVGAIWLAHRVLDNGVSYDEALAEAREVGLRSDALIERTQQYIASQQGGE